MKKTIRRTEATDRFVQALKNAFGGKKQVEEKDDDLRLTIDPNIFNQVDRIFYNIYREKKEIEQIKFKKALYITSIVCTTVLVVASVLIWRW